MHATASMLSDAYSGPVLAPSVCRISEIAGEPDHFYETIAENGNCVRGLVVALGLEAATALSLCLLWQVWHHIR